MASPVHPDTNLNSLNASIFLQLTDILQINETWKRLIEVLPEQYLCTARDIQYYEQGVYRPTEPAAAVLRDLGNKGMTAGELIPCLETLQLERALLLMKDYDPVKITRDLPSYAKVPFGFNSNFKLECKVTGFPRPAFQWFKMSDSETWEELTNQISSTLTFKPVRYADDGVYICRVHNRNPHSKESASVLFTKEFRLEVEPVNEFQDSKPIQISPPVISIHPRLPGRGAVDMGSNLIFECQAKGAKPISYEWFKNGNIIKAGTSLMTNEALECKSFLKIDNIQPENDEPKFTIQCQATNPGGVTMSKEYKFSLMTGPSARFSAEDKVALLIGNGCYKDCPELPNVQNDIIALAQALKAMDFKVLTFANLGKNEIYNAVDEFCKLLDNDVYGVFYYAGHGFQSNRRCYMVPLTSEEHVTTHEQYGLQDSICLDYVEEQMQRKNPALCCLIIDMCRNNIDRLDQEVEVPNPGLVKRNRIYAYATTNSCSALDGKAGGNGLFMRHLLKGISLRKPLKEVLDKVVEDIGLDFLASNIQIPEISSTLCRRLSLADDIMPKDLTEFKRRNDYYSYLKNLPNTNQLVCHIENVQINIEVEPLKQILDNVLDVKLSVVHHAGLDEKYTAYVERITTSREEKVEAVQHHCTIDEQLYTQVLISNVQKIRGHVTMDVVLFCYPAISPSVRVPLGIPLIAHACLWRQPRNLEDPPESGFHSDHSIISH